MFDLYSGERYVYKFVCDPEALFQMALAENHRNALKLEAAASHCAMGGSYSAHHHYHRHPNQSHVQNQPGQGSAIEEGLPENLRHHVGIAGSRCRHQYSDMLNQVYSNHLQAQMNSHPTPPDGAGLEPHPNSYPEHYQGGPGGHVQPPNGPDGSHFPLQNNHLLDGHHQGSRHERRNLPFPNYDYPHQEPYQDFRPPDPLEPESQFHRIGDTQGNPQEDSNNNNANEAENIDADHGEAGKQKVKDTTEENPRIERVQPIATNNNDPTLSVFPGFSKRS